MWYNGNEQVHFNTHISFISTFYIHDLKKKLIYNEDFNYFGLRSNL